MSISTAYEKFVALGLTHAAYILDKNQMDYQKQDLDAYEILNILLDSEITHRHNKRIQSLIKAAKMRYSNANALDIIYSANRGLKKTAINPLLDLEWINNNYGLIITGASGTGKTWLACAFAKESCQKEFKTLFISAGQLYEELQIALLNKTVNRVKQKYIKAKLLVIDDFGLGGIETSVMFVFLDIIDKQMNNGGLIMTSQFPIGSWHGFIEDATLADALLDRIIHRSRQIDLKGDSMRKTKNFT